MEINIMDIMAERDRLKTLVDNPNFLIRKLQKKLEEAEKVMCYCARQPDIDKCCKETKKYFEYKQGCGVEIEDDYWQHCGDTDMGQSAPILCVDCGGDKEVIHEGECR